MKGYIFLVLNVAAYTAFAHNDASEQIEIGEDMAISQINKDSVQDDIILLPIDIQRSSIRDVNSLWIPPVPYVLENDVEINARGVILKAFDQYRLKSCIDFIPATYEDFYISVQKLDGCFSYIGKVFPGQTLSIGRFCDEISTVEHEFLHALGFFHEQSRYDRDDYVTIAFENVEKGFEGNFYKVSERYTTTAGEPYDYWSVMHYGQNDFTNGNGSTIITKDPDFQDVIGQRQDMSPSDIRELNRRYQCKSTIAFKMYCGFSGGTMCHMQHCSKGSISWEMVTRANGGPSFDHTSLPTGSSGDGQVMGYFMHVSTAKGSAGDSALLETHKMSINRKCHVQCLQFYYYHSGSKTDVLNIWLREFHDEWDPKGTRRLMGQITGPQTSHWQLHHVSLNAKKHFQVEFEVHKGAGSSSGGFSIDDINLSEIECPHVTMQMDDLENLLATSTYGTVKYSPRQYSRGGYAYRVGVGLYGRFVGTHVQFLSGKYDDELEWPCPNRQVTFHMVDQTPNIQLHMSKQRSFTTDPEAENFSGDKLFDNPRLIGTEFLDENNQTAYKGPLFGKRFFTSLDEMKTRDFLKGGSAVFVFSFQDLNPLVNKSDMPCPEIAKVIITKPPYGMDEGPCSTRIVTTHHPPTTTDDKSIFGFSPAMVASPLLTILLALMLMIP